MVSSRPRFTTNKTSAGSYDAKSYQETATAMTAQLEQQNTVVVRLKKDMQTLEQNC